MATATATKEKPVKRAPPGKVEVKVAERAGTFAIIATGGKQYTVAEGQTIKIEKMKGAAQRALPGGEFKEGDKVTFDKVLLTDSSIGMPYVAGAKVTGTITKIGRNKKVTVIHYKQKSRYFKKAGHRQPYFKVRIEKIG